MFDYARPLMDGGEASLAATLFLIWDRSPGLPSLQDALLTHLIRQRLELLPGYTVFDWLEFRVEGSTVVMEGMATTPGLAERVRRLVSSMPAVNQTLDRVERLPDSPADNLIREEAFGRIYGDLQLAVYQSSLGRAAQGWAEPARAALNPGPHDIRLLVRDGVLMLRGRVASARDRDRACHLARAVNGVVRVECQLAVVSHDN